MEILASPQPFHTSSPYLPSSSSVYSVVDMRHLLCTYTEYHWTPTHRGFTGFCAHGASWMLCVNRAAGKSRHAITYIASAHVHVPLSHGTSLTKHSFKDTVIKHFRMPTAKQYIKCGDLLNVRPYATSQVMCSWNKPWWPSTEYCSFQATIGLKIAKRESLRASRLEQ